MTGLLKRKLRTSILPLAVAASIFVLPTSSAFAQEAVGLRAWAHSDFGRMVFDWPADATVTTVIQNNQLVLTFSRPFETSLAPVAQQLSAYLGQGQLSGNQTQLVFPLQQNLNVSSFKNGRSIVVDLKPVAAQAAQTATQATSLPAGTVGLRVGRHDEFTRLVFDWANPVTYEAGISNGALTLTFEAPAQFNLNQVRSQLPANLTALESQQANGRTILTLRGPSGLELRHFKSGNKVVVDLLNAVGDPAPAQETAPQTQTAQTQNAATQNTGQDADAPPPPRPAPTVEVTDVTTEEASAPPQNEAEAVATEVVVQTDVAAQKTEEQIAAEIAEQEAAAEAAEQAGTLELRRPDQEELAQRLAEKKRAEKALQSDTPPVSLTIPWSEAVGAAVFRRGENIWVVFDKRAPIDLAPLRAAGDPLITRIEQLPIGGATVLRIKALDGVNPTVSRESFDWILEFKPGPIQPNIQASIQAEVDNDIGPHLSFPSEEPGVIINLPDPDVGDTLRVATLREPGIGMRGQRVYPEFTLLASAQGLAVESFSDQLLFDRDLDGYQLSSYEGLHISAISPEASIAEGAALSQKRLFNFTKWQKGGPRNYIKDFLEWTKTIQETPEAKKNEERLKFAQFYLSHGRGPEAKGVLGVVSQFDQAIETRPDFRALLGAAHVLNRDYDSARQTLNDPRLDGFSEIAIWRAAALAEAGEWKMAADNFGAGDAILSRYPQPLKGRLGLLRIEAALAVRDLRTAENWIDDLDKDFEELSRSQQAAIRYHQARIALSKNNLDQARNVWTELAEGNDEFNAVRSQYALVNLGLKEEVLSVDEGINILDKLRYKWRGDSFELAVLRRLSELHFQKKDFRNGLNIMKTVVTYYPESTLGQNMAEDMVAIFKNLYLDGTADNLPPLKALAIYDEFRELTPSGPEGDLMIEKLSERLVEVDLLNRAAALLDHQVRFRLQGEDRARVGAKLALIYLIDGQAEDAIRALNASQSTRVSDDLESDRRRLRAKAAFELGDLEEAIKLLAGDVSEEADMLRRDMFWAEENWAEVSRVLQSLAGNPPDNPAEGLDDIRAGYVLNWAVALRLNEDEEGLLLLDELYGPAMQNSALANAYTYIVTPVDASGPEKLQDMIRQLANSDMFNAFINNYRDKLLLNEEDRDRYVPEDEQTSQSAGAGTAANG